MAGMALTFKHPLFLLVWPGIVALAIYLAYRRSSRSWLAIIARGILFFLLVAAAAEPALSFEVVRESVVILADQSASLGEVGKARIQSAAQSFLGSDPNVRLIAFGRDPWPVEEPGAISDIESFDENATDIASALRLAGDIIGSGDGRIVLLSDGQETTGQAVNAAKSLASLQIPIDVWFVPPQTPTADVAVDTFTLPPVLYLGQAFDAETEIVSSLETTATLRLLQGSQVIAEREVELTQGSNIFSFEQVADREGIVGLTLEVDAPEDTFLLNNYGSAVAQIYPSPRVLMVSTHSNWDRFRKDLQASGILSDQITPAELTTRISAMSEYQALFLIDVGANDFSVEQMALIESFVHDEGRGLITTGGPHSYILGGDKGTPLETVRPVSMEPPPKPQEPNVTLLLILDNSASMEQSVVGQVSVSKDKIVLAREAAVLASQTLAPEDHLGVLTFSDEPNWAVDIQPVGSAADLAVVQAQISAINTKLGTNIMLALEEGLHTLENAPAGARYAILLSDGHDFGYSAQSYEPLILDARKRNITLSTIAFGQDADAELLNQLAVWGQGRFYHVVSVDNLPVLMAEEAARISESPVSEGIFQPEVGLNHPVLTGIPLENVPDLVGYHALTPKPSAEVILRTGEGDPLLATWQYGLGRSTAWTSDLGKIWAPGWPSWGSFPRLWTQIIAHTLPDPALNQMRVSVDMNDRIATITAKSLDDVGRPISLAKTMATIVSPDDVSWDLPLVETSPGHYQQTVAVSLNGPYHVSVTQETNQGLREAEAGFVVGYSREFLNDGSGDTLLAHIASLTGGEILTDEDLSLANDNPEAETTVLPLWPYLLVAAAIVWPLDIAIRRWRMPWQ